MATGPTDPAPQADRSAEDELSHVIGRMYARHHVATVLSGALRSVGQPSTVRAPAANAAALALAATQATWLQTRLDADAIRDERVAWLDALAGATTTAVGVRALDIDTWTRGTAWCNAHTLWCVVGAVTMGSPWSRPARVALLALPHVLPRSARRSLGPLLPGVAVSFVAFGGIAALLRRRLVRTAGEIEEAIADLVRQESELARRSALTDIQRTVIARTVERIVTVRTLLAEGRRGEASEVAAAEHARLRAWFSDEGGGLIAVAPLPDERIEERLGAEDRVRRSLRILELTFRASATGISTFEVLRRHRRSDPQWSEWVVIAAGVAHLAYTTNRLLGDGADTDGAAGVLAADVAMQLVNGVFERFSTSPIGRPSWSFGYGLGLAVPTGALREGQRRSTTPALAGLARAATGLLGRGPWRRRVAQAIDEGIVMADASSTAQWGNGLALDQARDITRTAAATAATQAALAAEATRQEQQFFVHDSAVQVLLWVNKPDLDDHRLLAWIDAELPRLEAAAAGHVVEPVRDLGRELEELIDGFRVIGIDASARVEGHEGFRDLSRQAVGCLVDVLNEGLTNVFKHSGDRNPAVRVTADEDVTLTLTNHLDGITDAVTVDGLGTRSMTARVAAAGGRLRVGPDGDRWQLTCTVPGAPRR